jgi:hypothetical protein
MNPDQQPGINKEVRKIDNNVLTKDGNDEGQGLSRTSFGRAQDVQTTQCQALGEKKRIRSSIRVT